MNVSLGCKNGFRKSFRFTSRQTEDVKRKSGCALFPYAGQGCKSVDQIFNGRRKKRIHTLLPEVIKVYENSKREIKTSLLNDVIIDAYNLNLPPSYKGKRLKIYFSAQVNTCPPTFNIQVNSKGLIHFSYERYLENKIRESFDFEGVPIVLHFKNKGGE